MSSTLCPHCRGEISRTTLRCPRCGGRISGEPTYTPDSLITQFQSAIAGKYKIRRELGKGGMAVVYEAEDLALERRVALKFLLPDFSQDDEVLERFRREAIVASKLDHPAIVPIYNIGKADRYWYIVMKYIDGDNLKHFLQQKGKFSIQEATALLAPIARALDYAHENGVIHRDVKSSNFLMSKSGKPFLSDFGIAKAVDSMQVTRTGAIVGTPEYMSPEQADGRVCDHRADLYSFGVVIYELLIGRPPFKGETPFATALKHIHEEVEFPGGTPSDLIAILRKSLAKAPAKRYQSAQAIIHDLESVSGKSVPSEGDKTPVSRRVADREKTPQRVTPEGHLTPAKETEPKSPVPRVKKKNFTLPLVAGLIIFIFIMLLLPDSGTKNQGTGTKLTNSPAMTMTTTTPPEVSVLPDTSHPSQPARKDTSKATPRTSPSSTSIMPSSAKEELILNISSPMPGSDELRAYIVPSVDAQYGDIECVKDEAGNNVLKVGSRMANGSDLELTSAAYVERNAVVKDLRLPAVTKFPRTGGFIIVVLGGGSGAGERDIRGYKPFHVEKDGNVANFDGMEFSGNQRIVSFIIE